MQKEAISRSAPVFHAENSTKETPFKVLVFTMLSSRTKDEKTIQVTQKLFKKAKTPKQILALGQEELEQLLYGVGFYRTKAKNLLKLCEVIGDIGRIPTNREELMKLPGVGRKTANIVLARAFGKNTLGVDVHVHRISNRLGIVKTKKPEETEKALVKEIPEKYLGRLNLAFVAFGQTLCLPRKPKCARCPINTICEKIGVKN